MIKGECKSFLIETIDGSETPVPYIPYGIDRKDKPDAYVPTTDAYVPSTDAYVPTTDAYVPSSDAYVSSTVAYVPNADVSTQAPKGNYCINVQGNPQRIRRLYGIYTVFSCIFMIQCNFKLSLPKHLYGH